MSKESEEIRNQTLIVEIVGPAGAGKTTLVQTISRLEQKIEVGVSPNRLFYIPFFISNVLPFIPVFISQYRKTKWFSSEETRSMVYLAAWHFILTRRKVREGKIIILDHGPIYRLTMLREFGPKITCSRVFERWWNNMLAKWVALMDGIIWLDAPNEILKERIDARKRWHKIKNQSEDIVNDFLNNYRNSYEQIIELVLSDINKHVLRIETQLHTPEQAGIEVLAFLKKIK